MPNCSLACKFIGENKATILTERKYLNYDDVILTVIPKPFLVAIRSFAYGFSTHDLLLNFNASIKPNSYRF